MRKNYAQFPSPALELQVEEELITLVYISLSKYKAHKLKFYEVTAAAVSEQQDKQLHLQSGF